MLVSLFLVYLNYGRKSLEGVGTHVHSLLVCASEYGQDITCCVYLILIHVT